MFNPKDKNGKDIYLKDEVSYTSYTSMGEELQSQGIVIMLPANDRVQVQPIEGDVPVILDTTQVEVTYSLVHEVLQLNDCDELKKILSETEERYQKAVDAKKTTRRGGGARKKAAPKNKTINLDLGF